MPRSAACFAPLGCRPDDGLSKEAPRDGEQNKPGTGMFPGLISGQFREKVKGGEEYGMGYTRCCG